jgi:hypothetical protein
MRGVAADEPPLGVPAIKERALEARSRLVMKYPGSAYDGVESEAAGQVLVSVFAESPEVVSVDAAEGALALVLWFLPE